MPKFEKPSETNRLNSQIENLEKDNRFYDNKIVNIINMLQRDSVPKSLEKWQCNCMYDKAVTNLYISIEKFNLGSIYHENNELLKAKDHYNSALFYTEELLNNTEDALTLYKSLDKINQKDIENCRSLKELGTANKEIIASEILSLERVYHTPDTKPSSNNITKSMKKTSGISDKKITKRPYFFTDESQNQKNSSNYNSTVKYDTDTETEFTVGF
ncbi:MAG: hypothetical protein A3E88_00075 [Legionellales bacterium RIFCSPHIGHO2_12_FULL_35_11]|nr:MAG: hypothetical protein A3E88_00075 [Legionellales bacterium RIFCSPHIGHO2_12_FULL_35_11]